MLQGLLRAPSNLGMKVLDKNAFVKLIPTVAAYVTDKRDISGVRKAAAPVLLADPSNRTSVFWNSLYKESEETPEYAIPLSPSVKADDETTMPSELFKLVKENRVKLVPKTGKLDYRSFNSDEILKSVLPPDSSDGVQHGFTTVGHVAQTNIRDEWLEYKDVIAQVILDKNPLIRTVINKIEEVGSVSEFRTFPMELLAGDTETMVNVKSNDCIYEFDFAKVYWNTRLENEHLRIANLCKPGEAVCDVMAGVGPFAIPAAKKNRALVWANDLNPDSYSAMKHNITRNRVSELVRPFNADGRAFIRGASRSLLREAGKIIEYDPRSRNIPRDPKLAKKPSPTEKYTSPKVFSRFFMNLPASAVEFLDAFIGLYAGQESIFENPARPQAPDEEPRYKLPIVHVYTFNRNRPKPGELEVAAEEICSTISEYLDYPMTVEYAEDLRDYTTKPSNHQPSDEQANKGFRNPDVFVEGKAKVGHVRLVAPNKAMYCASFRLPREVAFRQPRLSMTAKEQDFERMKDVWLKSDPDVAWPGKLK